ncbi:unnamed protein product [Brassica napus]|uniref:(rape) hypothetical protein n=1 Tax=Brassica napus TaxID=3708 RepID=A0A816VFV4_BRANA|nr:unnamed protein product [Brassica napus]
MENIRNPKNSDDHSEHISRNTRQSVDNSLSRSYTCSFCLRLGQSAVEKKTT